MKILLVEDDVEISTMLKNFLSTENYEVVTASDGESALGFYEILSQKDFQVEISIPESPVYAQGEKDALQRILFHLLSNAIRYGSDGKYLGIFLREEKNSVFIDVVDRGKGIEEEFTDSVFERLYTMEDSRNREMQGNGLGLAIAKNLAVQLGGDLSLDSIPNSKTVFTVRLKSVSYRHDMA